MTRRKSTSRPSCLSDVNGPLLPLIFGAFSAAQRAEADILPVGPVADLLNHPSLDSADECGVILRFTQIQKVGRIGPCAET